MGRVAGQALGAAAVEAVRDAVKTGNPFAIVFLDIRMPPGIDGIETAKQIRAIDPNINIVIVTGSLSPEPEDLGAEIPPADRIFFFKKTGASPLKLKFIIFNLFPGRHQHEHLQ